MINVAITCNLSRSVWSGSIKQSAINLYDCLQSGSLNAFYLTPDANLSDFGRNHKAYNISQILFETFPKIDVLILHGYSIPNEQLNKIIEKHNCKVVLYHHENRIAIDQHNLLKGETFQFRMKHLSEIWVPDHHDYSVQYLKAFHATDAPVKTVPYLWSPFFIDSAKKGKNLTFDPNREPQLLVMEPNANTSKTCLIPLLICETFNRAFGKSCKSYSFFNTASIKINKGAKNLISQFSASEQNKIFLNKGWKTFDAIDRLGQFILSHQSENDLNYLYFESLHLGLPLIHNSERLKGYGYFYEKYDINTASNQIYNAIINHEDNLKDYVSQNQELIKKYLPTNPVNIDFYKKSISQML